LVHGGALEADRSGMLEIAKDTPFERSSDVLESVPRLARSFDGFDCASHVGGGDVGMLLVPIEMASERAFDLRL